MIYGYCRVSTKAQEKDGNSLEDQEARILEKYPSAIIYKEAYTGTKLDRPVFNEVVSMLQSGDTLACVKMDRFARNTVEGINVVRKLFKRGVSIHIFNVGLLEDSPMGNFFLTVMLAVAELERNQIIERTQMGRRVAKEKAEARGEKFIDGRPPKYTDQQLAEAAELLYEYSYKEVVQMTGIPKSTLIRARRRFIDIENERYAAAVEKKKKKAIEGRPKKYTEEELTSAIAMLDDYSYNQVKEMTGISKGTILREMQRLAREGDDE